MSHSQKIHLSASIIAADFTCLGNEIEAVIDSGVDSIHFDVMDHHYVPNLSIGPMVCASIHKKYPELFIDVHLMVTDPEKYLEPFAKAGARQLSIHPETVTNPVEALQSIRALGMQAGLVFNPDEPITIDARCLELLDQLLIMSVKPGFGGQSFIENSINTIKKARELLDEHKHPATLAVDGGIGPNTIGPCRQAGAEFFVVGSALFSTPNYATTVSQLRGI